MSGGPIRRAEIVTVGDELLLGEVADTNFTYLAGRMSAFGLRVTRHTTVPDETADIRRALREAAGRVPLVIVTGGLGVTPDDRTRQALAEAAGVKLVADVELIREMEVFYKDRKIRMPVASASQAFLPDGAQKIPNRVGLAPGLRMKIRRSSFFVFPGVPAEMRHLTEEALIPFLRERNGEAEMGGRVLRTWGLGENGIAEKLSAYLAEDRPVTVAFLPERRGITLRFRLKVGEPTEARRLLDRQVDDAADILGDFVYSTREEELEEVVAYLLLLHRKSVAVAESCTGGRVADLLTSVPGSSAYFREGFVAYHRDRKVGTLGIPEELIERHGTVSAEVAGALAGRARLLSGADIGLGVTGVAGPAAVEGVPVGRVFGAVDGGAETVVRRWDLPGSRNRVKERAARSLLDLLRIRLIRGAGGTA